MISADNLFDVIPNAIADTIIDDDIIVHFSGIKYSLSFLVSLIISALKGMKINKKKINGAINMLIIVFCNDSHQIPRFHKMKR